MGVVEKLKKTLVCLLCHGILAHDLPLPQGNTEGRKTSTLNVFCILYIIIHMPIKISTFSCLNVICTYSHRFHKSNEIQGNMTKKPLKICYIRLYVKHAVIFNTLILVFILTNTFLVNHLFLLIFAPFLLIFAPFLYSLRTSENLTVY